MTMEKKNDSTEAQTTDQEPEIILPKQPKAKYFYTDKHRERHYYMTAEQCDQAEKVYIKEVLMGQRKKQAVQERRHGVLAGSKGIA